MDNNTGTVGGGPSLVDIETMMRTFMALSGPTVVKVGMRQVEYDAVKAEALQPPTGESAWSWLFGVDVYVATMLESTDVRYLLHLSDGSIAMVKPDGKCYVMKPQTSLFGNGPIRMLDS